jgi:superfamily II DNA helicase RecQ
MPESNKDVQQKVEQKLGVWPCLWQIQVVRKILEQDDIITIAAMGSGKSLTYWMPLLFIEHGVVVLVTPLKLLGKQFVKILTHHELLTCCFLHRSVFVKHRFNTTHQISTMHHCKFWQSL